MIARLSLIILSFLLTLGSARADWVATGRFTYGDRLYDASGFTSTGLARSVREADVQVYDLTTLQVLGTGSTSSTGNFSITVTDAIQRNVGVRVLASNTNIASLNFSVVDDRNSNAVYSYHAAATDVTNHQPDTDVNFGTMSMPMSVGTIATTDWSSQVFNMYDMLVLAADWVATLEPTRPTTFLTIRWNPNNGMGSAYYSSGPYIQIADQDGYNDPVILHEIGHFIEHQYGMSRNTGGTHYFEDDDQDPRLSFSEGFASYVASAVIKFGGRPRPDIFQDRASFDVNNSGFTYLNEGAVVGGSTNELAVTAALYDLIDDASTSDASVGTDDDSLSGLESSIWAVLKQFRVASTPFTQMEDFWDTWFSLSLGNASGLTAIFAAHSMHYSPDAQEPNDSTASSTALTVNGSYQQNTFYRSGAAAGGDEDWFRFTAVAGTYYYIEVNGAGDTIFGRPDPEMWLLDGDLTQMLAYNDDPYDSVLNTNQSDTAQDMLETVPTIGWRAPAAGTYYVYLRHASYERNLGGRYGTYQVRVRSAAAPGAPTISAVAEQQMLPGQTYQTLVTGTNFSRGAVVSTNLAGATVSTPVWLSTTALMVNITPPIGAADGSYSLTVHNYTSGLSTLTPAYAVSSTAQPPIVISELNLSAGFVEIRNLGTVSATLTGWIISCQQPSSTNGTFTFPTFTLPANTTVMVRETSGTDTAAVLYDRDNTVSWSWFDGSAGDISLRDAGERNVDYIRIVSSPVSSTSDPQGTGGRWLGPNMQSPTGGAVLARSETTAVYRTPYGLSWAAPTMPLSTTGRDNAVDAYEGNDTARRCGLFPSLLYLPNLKISSRPSGTFDSDWFGFMLKPGDPLFVTAAFTHSSGNLDMEIYAPGEETTPLMVSNGTTNSETIQVTSSQSSTVGGGIYRVRVYGVGSAVNTYTLTGGSAVSLAVTDSSAIEGTVPDKATFTVTRIGPTDEALTVNLALTGTAQEGADYQAVGTTVTIPAGSASTLIDIVPIRDQLAEGTEQVILTLVASADYNLGAPFSGTVTIADPPLPVLTLATTDSSGAEGSTPNKATFTITRSGSTEDPLTVNLALTGSAQDGVDYQAVGSAVTIAVGSASATIDIVPALDQLAEGTEQVILTLVGSATYNLGTPISGTITITDSALGQWRFTNFGGDTPNSGDTMDPDKDGMSNLLEYGVRSNPNLAGKPIYPLVTVTATTITLTYQRDLARPEITMTLQESYDPRSGWTDLTDTLVGSPGGVELRRRVVPIQADAPRFFRLKVSRPLVP